MSDQVQDNEKTSKKTPQPTIIAQNCKKVNRENADWVYSEAVKDHFLSPRNFMMGDENQYHYDAMGLVGNPVCGDQMKMYITVQDDVITDVKWKTYGCASAIASTSALSELVKGKTLDQALKVGPAEITQYLGGLPKHKFHCSVLGHEALAAAIEAYREAQSSKEQDN